MDQATVWTPEMEYNNIIIARSFQGGPSRFRNWRVSELLEKGWLCFLRKSGGEDACRMYQATQNHGFVHHQEAFFFLDEVGAWNTNIEYKNDLSYDTDWYGS